MQNRIGSSGPVFLHGIGHFHPPNVIDNRFLTDLDIGTDAAWIEKRLGILERHTVLDLEYIRQTRNADIRQAPEASRFSNPEMLEFAARAALQGACIDASALGLIVSGSCCPQYIEPAESFILADRLGIQPNCFGLNAGCSGFLAQLSAIAAMGPNAPEFVLLTQAENMTRHVDYNERVGACIWGDCTTAVVVSTRVPSPAVVKSVALETIPDSWAAAMVPATGHTTQKTSLVREVATRALGRLEHFKTDAAVPPYVIFHQTSPALLKSVASNAGISAGQHLFNSDRYGNCASAGCVSVLSQNWCLLRSCAAGLIIVTVGAGLACGRAELQFGPS